MPAPTPRTWTAGETVTAAMLNTNLRDAVSWLVTRPYLHAYQTAAQTFSNATFAAVTMGGELVDTITGHSTSVNTSRYTPNIAGNYLCLGQIAFDGNATGQRVAQFRKNGSAVTGSGYAGFAGFAPGFAVNTAFSLATINVNGSTDYIELWGTQNSGGSLGTDVTNSAACMVCIHVGV